MHNKEEKMEASGGYWIFWMSCVCEVSRDRKNERKFVPTPLRRPYELA